ncbi:hypothetical protein ACFVS2_20280 [Brevibacillus sp. NPDC058079]|uniref:hypothetical protein n=1 Tax=Brevibacillus sp. NPDC058079 TaxID=3346330 RepID=UPI0036E28E6A
MMFDIEFDHELFLSYIEELHTHLFETQTLEDLVAGVHEHHQKHHMVTLHVLKDKKTFRYYYNKKDELNITSLFNIIIGTLTENVTGDKIKEHLVSFLELSPEMMTEEPSDYEKKVLMKNLKSFMMYARKRKGVFDRPE